MIQVDRIFPNHSVRLNFVGDTFRFLRAEKARLVDAFPGLRVKRDDGTIVIWN